MTPSPPATSPVANQEAATADTSDTSDSSRYRRLALRYGLRGDGTVRPPADVAYDLRSRHGLQLSMAQVIALLSGKVAQ